MAGRKPRGERALTAAEKQAAYRARKAKAALVKAETSAAHLAKPKPRKVIGGSDRPQLERPPSYPLDEPRAVSSPMAGVSFVRGRIDPEPGSLLKQPKAKK